MFKFRRALSILVATAACGLLVAPVAADSEFKVAVSGASARVGDTATVIVTITAGGGFKPNDKYPHKVKNLSGSGVDLPSGAVSGTIGGQNIVFSVPVTPTSTGPHAVSGKVRFSVCNETECILKSAAVNTTVIGT